MRLQIPLKGPCLTKLTSFLLSARTAELRTDKVPILSIFVWEKMTFFKDDVEHAQRLDRLVQPEVKSEGDARGLPQRENVSQSEVAANAWEGDSGFCHLHSRTC